MGYCSKPSNWGMASSCKEASREVIAGASLRGCCWAAACLPACWPTALLLTALAAFGGPLLMSSARPTHRRAVDGVQYARQWGASICMTRLLAGTCAAARGSHVPGMQSAKTAQALSAGGRTRSALLGVRAARISRSILLVTCFLSQAAPLGQCPRRKAGQAGARGPWLTCR